MTISFEGRGIAGTYEVGIYVDSVHESKLKDHLPKFYNLYVNGNNGDAEFGEATAFITEYELKDDYKAEAEAEDFNIEEVSLKKVKYLCFEYNENVRYVRFNPYETTDHLSITEVKFFDTSNIIFAKKMFKSCWKLKSVNFTESTRLFIDTSDMFAACGELEVYPENLNTESSLNMDRMFDYCVKLKKLTEQFITAKCESMHATFRGCRELETFPEVMDVRRVKNMREIMAYCQKVDILPRLETSSCTNLKRAFIGCKSLTELPDIEMIHRNAFVRNDGTTVTIRTFVESIEQMCKDCESLGRINAFDTSEIKNFNEVFSGCKRLTNTPTLKTDNAKTMRRMFYGCESMEKFPELEYANVTDITEMFAGCTKLLGNVEEIEYDYISIKRTPMLTVSPRNTIIKVRNISTNEDQLINVTEGNTTNVFIKSENDSDSVINYVYILKTALPDNLIYTETNTNKKYIAFYNESLKKNLLPYLDETDTHYYFINKDTESRADIIEVKTEIIYDSELINGTGTLKNCIDPDMWWNKYRNVPIVQDGSNDIIDHAQQGFFTEYKDCFKDCKAIGNVDMIPEEWYHIPDEETEGEVYVYRVEYTKGSSDRFIIDIHKYHEIETLEDIEKLNVWVAKNIDVREVITQKLYKLKSYWLPKKGNQVE